MESSKFNELVNMSPLGSLPNEIMIDILVRLPAKSVCRFKCASKAWKAILGCEKFVDLHLSRLLAGDNDCILFRHIKPYEFCLQIGDGESSRMSQEFFSFRSKENLNEFLEMQVPLKMAGNNIIIDSCNGLVCLAESNRESIVSFLDVSLWNPTTREIRALPRYYLNQFTGLVTVAGLGFVFDPEAKDYLVVRIVCLIERRLYEVEVYSLSTDRWRVIESDLKGYYFHDTVSHVFMNRSLHWLVSKGHNINDQQYHVLSFDTDIEKFAELRIPDVEIMDEFLLYTTHPNGANSPALSLIVGRPFKSYSTWVLNEYGNPESWVKTYSVPLTGKPMTPLMVVDENRVLMENENDDGRLVMCDSEFRALRAFMVYRPIRIVKHIESFVSPFSKDRYRRNQ